MDEEYDEKYHIKKLRFYSNSLKGSAQKTEKIVDILNDATPILFQTIQKVTQLEELPVFDVNRVSVQNHQPRLIPN